jgi:hypothetical protein
LPLKCSTSAMTRRYYWEHDVVDVDSFSAITFLCDIRPCSLPESLSTLSLSQRGRRQVPSGRGRCQLLDPQTGTGTCRRGQAPVPAEHEPVPGVRASPLPTAGDSSQRLTDLRAGMVSSARGRRYRRDVRPLEPHDPVLAHEVADEFGPSPALCRPSCRADRFPLNRRPTS